MTSARRGGGLAVRGQVTMNAYAVIARAVEEGIRYGLNRADKYAEDDRLTETQRERVEDAVSRAVMLALDDVLKFESEP